MTTARLLSISIQLMPYIRDAIPTYVRLAIESSVENANVIKTVVESFKNPERTSDWVKTNFSALFIAVLSLAKGSTDLYSKLTLEELKIVDKEINLALKQRLAFKAPEPALFFSHSAKGQDKSVTPAPIISRPA